MSLLLRAYLGVVKVHREMVKEHPTMPRGVVNIARLERYKNHFFDAFKEILFFRELYK